MEEVKSIDVGAEKDEETSTLAEAAAMAASASDQPALASSTTLSIAAPLTELFETPMNAASPILSTGEDDAVIKEEITVTDSMNPDEIENSVATQSTDAFNLLLNFGGSSERDCEASIMNQESEFNLLGFPGPEQTSVSNALTDGPVSDPFDHKLGINASSDENNQEVRDSAAVNEITPIDDEIKNKSAGDESGSNIEAAPNDQKVTSLPNTDSIVEQGPNDIDPRSNENELPPVSGDTIFDEGVTLHSAVEEVGPSIPSSSGEISPVIDNQPQRAIEINRQEEVLNQSSNEENTGTAEITNVPGNSVLVAPRTEHTVVDAEVVDEKAIMTPQLTVDFITPVTSSPVSPVTIDRAQVGGTLSSDAQVNTDAEERTEEEEEWISMGLGLGDALRQIVALTEERDLSLALCQEKDSGKTQAEALLAEVQSRLEAEMNRRAESDSEKRKLRETLKSYEDRLKAYETMEDDLEKANANLVTVVTEKSKIEMEVHKLRDMVEESQQKEIVLSNRLNEAKKKEANKSTAAGRLEEENEKLQLDLQTTKDELETVSKAKAKLESNMEKLKVKAVERVKQAETALSEERELNEERKKKMKTFVETKAEELREAKECASNMQKELEETRASLRSSRDREEASLKELEAARLKNRELQRDMERMVRNSEQLHKAGNSLEQELEKYASETEEHKKKRMSAKHEIMQMVRTLEAERAVSAKLRESVKFTFTPKALSQQELLTECLRDFELELERLATKTGKALQPSSELGGATHGESTAGGAETAESNGMQKSKKMRASKADLDTDRLISNLEQETQHVSKGIMALAGDIERMRSLLNDDNAFGCLAYFSTMLPRTGEARHQRLGDGSEAH